MSTITRTYSRTDSDVDEALFVGQIMGSVSDPYGPLALAIDPDTGEAHAAADESVHQAYLDAHGFASDDEASADWLAQGGAPVAFVHLPAA